MSRSAWARAPAPYEAWEALTDGPHVQRFHLYVDAWRQLVHRPGHEQELFSTASPRTLATTGPHPLTHAEARKVVEGAGLAAWLDLPDQYDIHDATASPLSSVSAETAALLLDEGTDIAAAEAVRVVCEASAWWVGVFATVRHLGVHHATLGRVAALDAAQDRAHVLHTTWRTLEHHHLLPFSPHVGGLQHHAGQVHQPLRVQELQDLLVQTGPDPAT